MKRTYLAIALIVALCICLLTASSLAQAEPLKVVTTIFPIYDWVREILGEDSDVELTMLLDSGVDLHSYQPTVPDIVRVSTSDVFIYVGGESDEWVKDVLETAANPAMQVISLLDALGEDVKEEETVEGMEEEEESGDEDEEEVEYDEHVWLSLRNAEKLVKAISEVLAQADPDNADRYLENASAYIAKLDALDETYAQTISSAAFQTVLFGDRFPFRYLTDDYDLTYYAAFSGCSAETEASFHTVIFLAQKVDELGLPAVLTLENPQTRIAETIVENTLTKDQKVLSLNSMQGTTAEDVLEGATYLGIMEDNLLVLQEALN